MTRRLSPPRRPTVSYCLGTPHHRSKWRRTRPGYLTLKFLHLTSVALLLGNIATGIFWTSHPHRTGDTRIVAHTLEGIERSVRIFTLPSTVFILLFGFATAGIGDLGAPDSLDRVVVPRFLSLRRFVPVASGPLQRRMLSALQAPPSSGGFDWSAYRALSRQRERWIVISLLASAAATAIMVLKPAWRRRPASRALA